MQRDINGLTDHRRRVRGTYIGRVQSRGDKVAQLVTGRCRTSNH